MKQLEEELKLVHKDDDFSKMDKRDLLFGHSIMHRFWNLIRSGKKVSGWSLEDVYNYHRLVVQEMKKRGIKHNVVDALDIYSLNKLIKSIKKKNIKQGKYGQPNPSGNEKWEEIKLEQILEFFKPLSLSNPYVYLVGGIVNHGKTKGDIDILIKGSKNDSLSLPLEFRILRLFPKELWPRIHFLYDDSTYTPTHGPFTSHVPIYSLDCKTVDKFKRVEMEKEEIKVGEKLPEIEEKETLVDTTKEDEEFLEDVKQFLLNKYVEKESLVFVSAEAKKQAKISQNENKIKLFRFFTPLKPVISHEAGEAYSIENVLKLIKPEFYPYIVEKKYDGLRLIVFKSKDKVKIVTEDGFDKTHRLPSVVKELKAIKSPQDFILDTETEMWVRADGDRTHVSRDVVSGYINAKTPPDDKDIILNVFDILYFNDPTMKHHELNCSIGDLHEQPLSLRRKYLALIPFKMSTYTKPTKEGVFLNLAPYKTCKNQRELVSSIKFVTKQESSEGAVIKSFESIYPLTGIPQRNSWLKYKTTVELHVIITKRNPTKTPGVFNYDVALRIPAGVEIPERDKRIIGNKTYAYVGKTLNTKVKGEVGQICSISIHSLFVYSKDNIKRIRIYESKWIGLRKEQKIPDSFDDAIKKAEDEGLVTRKTLSDYITEITLPPKLERCIRKVTRSEIKKFVKEHGRQPNEKERKEINSKAWRICRAATGLSAQLTDPFMVYPPEEKSYKFVVQTHWRGKGAHNDFRMEVNDHLIGWTLFTLKEGAVEKPVETLNRAKALDKIASIWKTPIYPGNEKKKILCTKKARIPKEWLTIEGVVPRGEVGATKHEFGVFSILDKGTVEFGAQKPYFHEYFLKGNKFKGRWVFRLLRLKGETVWMCQNTLDETPYVLTRRAYNDKWVPPQNISALPKELRKKIPKEFQYWKHGTEAKRLEIRNNLLNAIKRQEVKLFELKTVPFTLQHHWRKGPVVVRAGPSKEHWDININKNGITHFELLNNPLDGEKIVAHKTPIESPKLMTYEGEIKPGEPGNPTKKTPTFIEIIDKGTVTILEDSDQFKKYSFKGKKLKGLYVFKLEKGTKNIWVFEKSKLPQTLTMSLQMCSLGENVYEGTALTYGVWNQYYFPPSVIMDRPERLIGLPIVYEHTNNVVGKILDVNVIENDLKIKFCIDDYSTNKEIKEGILKGLSIDADVNIDFVKNLILEIKKYNNVAVTKNPACKECLIINT